MSANNHNLTKNTQIELFKDHFEHNYLVLNKTHPILNTIYLILNKIHLILSKNHLILSKNHLIFMGFEVQLIRYGQMIHLK